VLVLLVLSLLVLAPLPACRRTSLPMPSFPVQVTLAQVTASQMLPGEIQVTPARSYLIGADSVVITFHFPRAMDRQAAGAAVLVKPAIAHEIRWTGDDLLQLRLVDLPLDLPVQVGLGEGARTRSGEAALPVEFSLTRVEAPAVLATVEGQPGVTGPGRYRLLAGRKTVRLDFTHAMDRTAVEKMLLPQLDPRCQPSLQWESDRLAYLHLDLLQGTRVEISFLGWPDNRGVPSLELRPFVLEGVGTVRLVAGASPDRPTPLTTLLDQFSQGTVAPDGRRVALLERFPVGEAEEVVVWHLDLASHALGRLASFMDTGQFALHWTPDSRHLVVSTGSRVVRLDTAGGKAVDLLEAADGVVVGMAVAPTTGRVACFVASAAEEGAAVDLVVAGKDATATYPAVTHLYSREGFWVPVPCAWSPDEAWIAFADLRPSGETLLTLIDPEKGGTRLLPGQAEALASSPSGGQLAVRNPDGSWDLVNPGEGTRIPLLPAEDSCREVFWSRTGEQACFARAEGGFLLWDRKQGTTTSVARGIPLGWSGNQLLWISP
jgi:hypothetical protein